MLKSKALLITTCATLLSIESRANLVDSKNPIFQYRSGSYRAAKENEKDLWYSMMKTLNLGPVVLGYSSKCTTSIARIGEIKSSTVTIKRMSSDLKSYAAEFRYEFQSDVRPLFRSGLKGGALVLRAKLNLKNCDGREIEYRRAIPGVSSLDEVISGFKDFDLSEKMYCEFAVSDLITEAILEEKANPNFQGRDHEYANCFALFYTGSPIVLRVNGEGEVNLISDPGHSTMKSIGFETGRILESREASRVVKVGVKYSRSQAITPSEHEGFNANVDQVVDFLVGYGNLLIDVRNLSTDKKELAMQSYFADIRKEQFLAALQSVNANLSQTGLLDLVNLQVRINQAYEYVRYLEMEIAQRSKLDEVVKLRL